MRDTKEPTVILKFRIRPERAELLQSIADAHTGGNISRLLRELAERKIATHFPRHAAEDLAA